jgi:hypothetical protein
MSTSIEAIIFHPAPNRSGDRPDATKIFGGWQSGLETPSGCKQWKLRLRLFAGRKAAPEPQRQSRAALQSL